jgi:hypothetical protein
LNASKGLTNARSFLRAKQEAWVATGTLDNAALTHALAAASKRELQTTADGDQLRAGPFTYDVSIEKRRLARTREIIARASPGWAEDGDYLEVLARQAASIEMFLEPHLQASEAAAGPLDRIIIGTLGQPRSNAWTKGVGDYAVIAVAAGMMNAYYQLSKAVVMSWRPVPAKPGSLVGFVPTPEAVENVLDANPVSLDVAFASLSSWFFDGVAQPPTSQAPEDLYHPALALLISYAERFVLSHEYCHALLKLMDQSIVGFPSGVLPDQEEEFRADMLGAWVVAESAAQLDSVAPNVALQSALLAMKVHETVDDALLIFGRPPTPSTTHPPFHARAKRVLQMYETLYAHLIAEDARLSLEPLLDPARTLDQIWARLRPRFVEAAHHGKSLHAIWS